MNLYEAAMLDANSDLLDKQDEGYNVIEHLAYGLSTTVASGLLDFANTGISISNMFGNDAELLDKEKAISSLISEGAGDYYDDNQAIIDMTGLIAGSLVPGVLAIKGLRLVQAGKAGGVSRAYTKLHLPKMPEKVLEEVTDRIKSKAGAGGLNKEAKLKLAANSFGTQALDAAVYEMATVLTMANGTSLQGEDLSYFGAVGSNLDTVLFGTVLGGGLGGMLATASSWGKAGKVLRDVDNKMNPLRSVNLPSGAGQQYSFSFGTAGSRISLGSHALADRIEAVETKKRYLTHLVDTNADEARVSAVKSELRQAENAITTAKTELTAEFRNIGQDALAIKLLDDTLEEDPRKLTDLLAGAVHFGSLKESGDHMYHPIENIMGITSAKSADVLEREAAALQLNTAADAPTELPHIKFDNEVIESATPQELMELFEEGKVALTAEQFTRQVELAGGNRLNPQQYKVLSDIRSYHAAVHPEAEAMIQQAATLEKRINGYNKQKSLTPQGAEKLAIAQEELAELTHIGIPKRDNTKLLKEMYAMVQSPKAAEARGTYKHATSFFTKNKRIADLYKPHTVFLNHKSGKVTDVIDTPTLFDLGKVTIRGGSVSVVNQQKGKTKEVMKFTFKDDGKTVLNMSPLEAAAHYASAAQNPKAYLRNFDLKREIDARNFPLLQAAMQEVDLAKNPLRVRGDKGKVVEVSSIKMMYDVLLKAKRTGVSSLQAKQLYNEHQIKQMLDVVDEEPLENFTQAGYFKDAEYTNMFHSLSHTQLLGGAEMTGEVSKDIWQRYTSPNWSEIRYAPLEETGEAQRKGRALAELEMRNKAKEANDAVLYYFGREFSELMPNAQDRMSQDNMADYLSQADKTNTMLRANEGKMESPLTVASTESGSLLNRRKTKHLKDVTDNLEAIGFKVANEPASVAELNIIQNLTQRERVKFYKSSKELLVPMMVEAPELAASMRHAFSSVSENQAVVVPSELIYLFRSETDKLNRLKGSLAKATESRKALKQEARRGQPSKKERALTSQVQEFAMRSDGLQDQIDKWLASRKQSHLSDGVVGVDNKNVGSLLGQIQKLRGESLASKRQLAVLQGKRFTQESDDLYLGAVNINKYPHVAFVNYKVNGSMFNQGKRTAIVAHSQEALASKMDAVQSALGDKLADKNGIITPDQVRDYNKARNEYEYDLDFTERWTDHSAHSNKVLAETLIENNKDIVEDLVHDVARERGELDRRFVGLYYKEELDKLYRFDKTMNNSKAVGDKGTTSSAYSQHINQFLDLPNTDVGSNWVAAQQSADKVMGGVYTGLTSLFKTADETGDYTKVAAAMDRAGLPQVYTQASDYLNLNVHAPSQVMAKFVPAANAWAGKLMLRLDAIQSLVNVVSLPIVLNAELGSMKNFIKDPEQLKRWDEASSIVNPDGSKTASNGKLFTASLIRFFTKEGKEQVQKYREQGIVGSMLQEVQQSMDNLANVDIGSVASMEGWLGKLKAGGRKVGKGIDKAVDAGAVLTRADWSEEMVKFVAADSVQQLMKGVNLGAEMKLAITKSFVKRVHGNYIHNQRAGLFQGFTGQAIGLFQTYQFNLLSRLFDHSAKGDKKAIATMFGLQGSIFGAQSLPGFSWLNDHIASRNQDHENIYTSLKGEWGDWFLYGAGSNFTVPLLGEGVDLYSRGDLTPRTPILIPTNLSEVPAYSMASRAMLSTAGMIKSMANGAPWGEAGLEALAHNGLNRPIAGMAQLALGYRTSNKGVMINTYSNEDMVSVTRAAKFLGTKSMDEAVAVNQYYRALKYRTARYKDLESVGTTVKQTIRAGEGKLTGKQMNNFYADYVELGGHGDSFNRWMGNQMVGATESNVNTLRNSLNSPEGRYLQMSVGNDLENF